jgi:hypothetical protein
MLIFLFPCMPKTFFLCGMYGIKKISKLIAFFVTCIEIHDEMFVRFGTSSQHVGLIFLIHATATN